MSIFRSVYTRFCGLLAAACLAIVPISLSAQVSDDIRSHVLFDLRLDKLREYTNAQGMDLNQMLSQMTERQFDPETIATISRVYGTIQLPKDMATVQPLMGMMMGVPPMPESGDDFDADKKEAADPFEDDGNFQNISLRGSVVAQQFELPVNFFVRLQFKDAASADAFAEDSMWPGPEPIEKNGNTFYPAPASEGAPVNLVWWKPNDNTVEVATTDYATQTSRRVFTDRLADVWATMPDDAIRIAVDLESVSTFVDELIAMVGQQAPPGAAEQIEMVKAVSTLKLSMDLQADNLVSVVIAGKDDAGADGLQQSLDQQLNMAQVMGGMAMGSMPDIGEDASSAAKSIIDSLGLNRDGNQLSLMIPRPDNFDAAVKHGLVAMQARAQQVNKLNNVRMVGLAVHKYYDSNRSMPFMVKGTLNPDLSWRARISPYMEGPACETDKAHDDAANAEMLDQMPSTLGSDGQNTRVYWIDNGDGGPEHFENITDGSSNTIMLLEGKDAIPWMKPGDLTIDEAVMLVNSMQPGESVAAVFYDGSARNLEAGLDEDTLRAMLTYKGGEVVNR